VVLVGDAAHSMSPHLGQGANLGLLDAECLARHLSNQSPAAALIAYAMERRRHSRYLAILSRVLTPFFQSGSHTLAIGRDVALPLMCAIPWIRRQMELTVAGVKRGFFDQL
jgi:2-polyprenyl-6-methoxyphenol hydroxylase-like FAD-dependent oxidoreductase